MSGRAATLLLAALFLAGSARAQMPEVPLGKWWKRPRVVEQLRLTPDQQQRLDEIFAKNRRSFIDLKADVERRSVDLEELMAKKDADPKRVAAAVDALEESKAHLGRARTMMVVEMKGALTGEQWQTILDRREEWRAEREDLRGRRRPFGPGRGAKERERSDPQNE